MPFVRSRKESINTLLEHLDMKPWQHFFEVWCGDGIVMAAVLDIFPWVITHWYEIIPEIYKLAEPYQKKYWENFIIHNADYYTADFSQADVIYSYLQPRFMKPIREKIKRECKAGTLLYANTFELKWEQPIDILTIKILWKKDNLIYIYQI